MTIVVTGAYGQLGGELCRQLGAAATGLDIDTLDLTDGRAAVERIAAIKPRAVINCAAYTAVDKAESEPEKCRAVNAEAVEHLVRACGRLDCPLVQISTDYVFGAVRPSLRPWREDDPCEPQGVYARTKLEGEWAAAKLRKHLIVRTCGLYARPSDPRAVNFVKTMLRLGRQRRELRIVDDQHCTPTFVPHLARAILFLLGATAAGRPLGNLSRDQYRQDNVVRVCHRDLPPGGTEGRHPPNLHSRVRRGGGPAVLQRARHLGLSSARRAGDARLEGSAGGVLCRVEGTANRNEKCKMQSAKCKMGDR